MRVDLHHQAGVDPVTPHVQVFADVQASDPVDCPDNLIYHDPDPSDERYSLIIHDGGNSYIAIGYCPCAAPPYPARTTRISRVSD